MTKSEVIRFLILRTIGNFLVLFSLFGVFATFGPVLYYEVQFRTLQLRGVKYKVAEVEQTQLGELLQKAKKEESNIAFNSGFSHILSSSPEQILVPKDTDFSVLIPKIGANEKIFPNIDSSAESEFLPILQKGVAHAKGTVFPGLKGTIYLFAHSADNFWDVGRYNAVFYLIKDLIIGDDIVIFFENKRHNYTVTDSKVLDAEDVESLVKSHEVKEEILILQTCWPPGTTWKRLIVTARPKK